jgi:hypothetical protein
VSKERSTACSMRLTLRGRDHMLRADFSAPNRITATLISNGAQRIGNLPPNGKKYTGVGASLEAVNCCVDYVGAAKLNKTF